jgi:hypothetical protein
MNNQISILAAIKTLYRLATLMTDADIIATYE